MIAEFSKSYVNALKNIFKGEKVSKPLLYNENNSQIQCKEVISKLKTHFDNTNFIKFKDFLKDLENQLDI